MSQEISTLINMSALAINEILDSAQQQGAVVVLETAMLESEELVRSVDKISLEAIPSDRKRGTVQLVYYFLHYISLDIFSTTTIIILP